MLFIFAALIFYTAAIMLTTIASRSTNPIFVAAIVNTVSAILPIALVYSFINKKILVDGKLGIIMAILGGILIALFTIALNKSFQVNKVAIVSPIVFGGTIFLSAILSYFFFKEKITLFQGLGLLFIGVGLIFTIYSAATGK